MEASKTSSFVFFEGFFGVVMYTQNKMVWEFVLLQTIDFEGMPIKKVIIFSQITFVSVYICHAAFTHVFICFYPAH